MTPPVQPTRPSVSRRRTKRTDGRGAAKWEAPDPADIATADTVELVYDDGTIRLFWADALAHPEVWALEEGGALVSDPPYGIAYRSNAGRWNPGDALAGDDDTSVRDGVLDRWLGNQRGRRPEDVTKAALVFGSWKRDRPPETLHRLIWDKGDSPSQGDLTCPWGVGDEEIYVIGRGYIGRRRTNVIRCNTIHHADRNRPDHPTPKPVPLMEQLVSYCPPGTIVDPCAGSGATLRAAKNLGRPAIGVEINRRYCAEAVRILQQEALSLAWFQHENTHPERYAPATDPLFEV